jgi:hypothetical protein
MLLTEWFDGCTIVHHLAPYSAQGSQSQYTHQHQSDKYFNTFNVDGKITHAARSMAIVSSQRREQTSQHEPTIAEAAHTAKTVIISDSAGESLSAFHFHVDRPRPRQLHHLQSQPWHA